MENDNVISIYFKFARGFMPFYVDWCVLMVLSYVVAVGYHWEVKRINTKIRYINIFIYEKYSCLL